MIFCRSNVIIRTFSNSKTLKLLEFSVFLLKIILNPDTLVVLEENVIVNRNTTDSLYYQLIKNRVNSLLYKILTFTF